MDYHEIIMKLIGPVEPVGESHTDDKRFKNLDQLLHLVDRLIFDISHVATSNQGRPEFSMSRAGNRAGRFLEETLTALRDDLEGEDDV